MNLEEFRMQGKSSNEKLEKALASLVARKLDRRGVAHIGVHGGFTYATNEFAFVVVRGFETALREGREVSIENCLDIVAPTGDASSAWVDSKLMRDVLRVFDAVGEAPLVDSRGLRLYLHSDTVSACIMGKRK